MPDKIIYEAFFVENSYELKQEFPAVHPNSFYHHLTIAFKPESLSMPGKVGSRVLLKAIGRLTTSKVDALLVEFDGSKNEFPHITLSTAPGVQPSESNKEFDNNPVQIFETPKIIGTRYGYFDGKEVVA